MTTLTTKAHTLISWHTRHSAIVKALMLVIEVKGKGDATRLYDVIAFTKQMTGGRLPVELLKVTVERAWSGGGIAKLHWADGTTQESRYGKQERRPSAMGGRSQAARNGWV